MATALFNIAHLLLTILMWIIIIQVVLSLLVAFTVLNTHSAGVRGVMNALDRLTEPLYRPIRRVLPDFGPIDFSPMVVIILIQIAHILLSGAQDSLIYGTL
jgi:YggT family protein